MLTLNFQQLGAWITNNWRAHKLVPTAGKSRKKSRLEIIWEERRDEVLEEVKVIVGKSDPTDKDNFQQRTAAAKAVYDRLSEGEKGRIRKLVETRKKRVNPPEKQRK